jgi:peptidoglycan/xylan/chitin deacetylase (PgdA/CDA1 family)
MPPRQDPVPRARAAAQWLGGLMLLGFLGAGVVAAAAALWENVDVQSLARRAAAVTDAPPPPPPDGPGPVASAGGAPAVALFESAASARYFPDSGFYRASLSRWEALLIEAAGRPVRVRDAAGVAALPAGALLVAPESVCLSDAEIAAFRRHLSSGGGLVLSWATAARDGACRWRGWEPLRSLTGALDLAEYPAEPALFLAVPAGLPLSPGIPPGGRIELYPEPHLALQTPGPHPYWSDWALNAPRGEGPIPDAAAVLHEPDTGGRVAWFGFRERQAVGERDVERVRRLLRNGVRWAAGTTVAEISTWPGGKRGALLVAQDVETGFENAAALARLLREREARGTFFAVSRMALDHPAIADSLRGAGEVASQTADHAPTAGLPLEEQQVRLGRSIRELEAWSGQEVTGLRPPEERFDEATLRAWRRAGGRYVAAVNDARSAAPEIYRTPDGSVALLPRLIKDDYNVFVQDGARRTDRLRSAWLEGMRKVEALGGLAYLSLHTQIAGTPDRVDVVGEVLDSAATRPGGWWVAPGAAIASWWMARDEARLELEARGDTLALRIRAPAAGLRDAWIDLYLPGGTELRPHRDGLALAWAPTEWGIRFPVEEPSPSGDVEILLFPPDLSAQGAPASLSGP